MTQQISIDPVTRLEGHGKIDIFLDIEQLVVYLKATARKYHSYNALLNRSVNHIISLSELYMLACILFLLL